MPPVIGITLHPATDPDKTQLDILLADILRAVERAGGLPVFIPLGLSTDTLHNLLIRLDGVLFPGGGDIDPARYGADMHRTISGVSDERDRVELALARWAVEEAKPFFGICRGIQALNVALGGTLYRDISEHPNAEKHTYDTYTLRPHQVLVAKGTLLDRVLGQPLLDVNSTHHQACKYIAPRLRLVANAPDGIVEALEVPEHPFGLAVQWHPESLPGLPETRRLFEAFIAAAREHGKMAA
jgi:gamma-glutamyl-gamma-aminobutyrate hydrolase PuuD